jgi:hypothetical protein
VDLNLDAESDLKYPSKGRKKLCGWHSQRQYYSRNYCSRAADQTLTSNLDTEITRARAAEALNTSDISNAQSQINAIATVKADLF